MPSTFTERLRLEVQADGENATTWGQKANAVFELLDEGVDGFLAIDVSGGSNVTLSANNAATDQSRQRVLRLIGTITANIEVIVPASEKLYVVWNATSGNFTLTLTPSGGTGLVIPQGTGMVVFTDGSTMWAASPPIQPATLIMAAVPRLNLLGTTPGGILLELQEVDDGTSGGPIIKLWKNSASPAIGAEIGTVQHVGEDGASAPVVYAEVKGEIVDPSTGAHVGRLRFRPAVAGSTVDRGYLDQHGWKDSNDRLIRNRLSSLQQQTCAGVAFREFTGLRADISRIVVVLDGVSNATGTTNSFQMVLGDSGGFELTGYDRLVTSFASNAVSGPSAGTGVNFSIANAMVSSTVLSGFAELQKGAGNAWILSGQCFDHVNSRAWSFGGRKALSATLDRLRCETNDGANWGAGSILVYAE